MSEKSTDSGRRLTEKRFDEAVGPVESDFSLGAAEQQDPLPACLVPKLFHELERALCRGVALFEQGEQRGDVGSEWGDPFARLEEHAADADPGGVRRSERQSQRVVHDPAYSSGLKRIGGGGIARGSRCRRRR